jgi:hypothetical protein
MEEVLRRLVVPKLRVESLGPFSLKICALILKICVLPGVVLAASIWNGPGRSLGAT